MTEGRATTPPRMWPDRYIARFTANNSELERCIRDRAIRDKYWNPVDYGIAARTTDAADRIGLEREAAEADGTREPAKILRSDGARRFAARVRHLLNVYVDRSPADGATVAEGARCTMDTMIEAPTVLNGIEIAAAIKAEVAAEVGALKTRGITPGLTVVLVGHVPASEIYVRSKVKASGELGIRSEMLTPPESVTTEQMLALVGDLNARDDVDGILIQLPLPKHVDTRKLLEAVSPEKDVDGFHPINAGRLQSGQPALEPCTPAGIMEILRRSNIPVAGKSAVVLGRSDIVGKPIAMMLLHANATVTVCHSKTVDIARYTREADIVVAAIGRPGFVTADMVKPGSTLIDVGINRLTEQADVERFFRGDERRAKQFAERGSTIVGDIDPAAFTKSGAYTPVPGGVGALTIAMLMQNTAKAAKARRGGA